uniref:Transcription factor IIIB 50 kDa subunit n=1 Tax=Paramormyrops kingsleyae TaxID=1676925 RepID=A0A3B3Q9J2_9TELE|nr:transcription factor IIIB 50 kDa subunit [Paramormyrops kingsleyae]XP_023693763.1 transcription factor IIIB 50 kDa subunit [Paramormyrops kingsleyae]XP_023693764.1 transcription factor IIIB 50 kDa subunit [Paramormyrops kingsleyae]XP_023693765.1 transcription factor IIIB 50 kDa subunit [Paramormyrops kingsleyae]
MMGSGRKCPDCGSSNVVEDDLYSQPQLVCTDCGSVVSEGQLTTTRSEEVQGTIVRYSQSTAVDKQPCRNQIKGLKRVRALCRILRLPPVIEETSESLFAQAYESTDFLHVSLPKKETLAGCCVLLGCRMQGWPVTMGTVTSLLDTDSCLMGTVYKMVVSTLKLESPHTNIMDLMEGHCREYHLSPPGVPEEFCESADRLASRASALVELASDTWLMTGRHPVPVMVASVYLAWLSLKPSPARLKLSLGRFCQMAKVAVPGPASKRVTELKEVLCRLGQELPWQKGAVVSPQKVAALVGDVLKHRISLLKRAIRSHEDALAMDSVSGTEGLDVANTPSSTLPLSLCTDGVAPICEDLPIGSSPCSEGQPDFHQSQLPTPHAEGCQTAQSVRDSEDVVVTATGSAKNPEVRGEPARGSAEHWGKRHPFVPPCARNPSKKPRLAETGPEVTGDEEISDSEIEGYLRTPLEMREFAETQMKLQSDSY